MKVVGKADLIRRIHENMPTNVTMKEITPIVEATFDAVKGTLQGGDDVLIKGFGKFAVVTTKERVHRNPKTGENFIVEPHKRVKFSASKDLKDAVSHIE